ncbi:unnamed protein product [Arctogadus glacialis]
MENNRKRVLNHITLSKAPCSIVPSLLTVYSTSSGAEREQCGFFCKPSTSQFNSRDTTDPMSSFCMVSDVFFALATVEMWQSMAHTIKPPWIATEERSSGKQKRRDVVVLILETVVATDELSLEGFESKDMV